MAKKPPKYRELRKILERYGIADDKTRGKGSERMFVGVVDGQVTRFPTKCHSENDEKPVAVINAIRRRFRLGAGDGVSDEQLTDAKNAPRQNAVGGGP